MLAKKQKEATLQLVEIEICSLEEYILKLNVLILHTQIIKLNRN